MPNEQVHEYDVAAVRAVLEQLAHGGVLETFLAECKAKGLKLAASPRLVALTLAELNKLPSIKTPSPGGCPSCPPGT